MPGKVRSDAAEQVLAVAQPEPEGFACHKNNVGSSDLWVMCPLEDDSLLGPPLPVTVGPVFSASV